MLGGQDLCFDGMSILLPSLSVPSIGTTDNMIKVDALINFTKHALLDRKKKKKPIQTLNEEQMQMRKLVIHNRMALDIQLLKDGPVL